MAKGLRFEVLMVVSELMFVRSQFQRFFPEMPIRDSTLWRGEKAAVTKYESLRSSVKNGLNGAYNALWQRI